MRAKPMETQANDEWAALQAASATLVAFQPLLTDISEAAEVDVRWHDAEAALRFLSVALDKANLPPPAEFAAPSIAQVLRNAASTYQMLRVIVAHVEKQAFRENVPWLNDARAIIAKVAGGAR